MPEKFAFVLPIVCDTRSRAHHDLDAQIRTPIFVAHESGRRDRVTNSHKSPLLGVRVPVASSAVCVRAVVRVMRCNRGRSGALTREYTSEPPSAWPYGTSALSLATQGDGQSWAHLPPLSVPSRAAVPRRQSPCPGTICTPDPCLIAPRECSHSGG